MRAPMWLLCLGLMMLTGLTALASDFEHQYGVELRGSRSMYMNMKDPNDYVKGFPWSQGLLSNEYTKSSGSFGGGISVLYKSRPYFAWHVGLNVLGTDSATAKAESGNQTLKARALTSAVELFFTANYYWNITPRLNLEFGAGPAFYLASMDRENPNINYNNVSTPFYGAHGRAFGFVGTLGCEFFLSKAVALKLGGGFRAAHVSRFKYIEEIVQTDGSTQVGRIAYWNNSDGSLSFNTFEADFSGPFIEGGFRFYFEPKGEWGHGDLRGQ